MDSKILSFRLGHFLAHLRRTGNGTYTEYATEVQKNLEQLHDRLKSGKYRAQPLRRVHIPKEDGRQRPISIPSLEDKIVQKAAVDLLNAIYEQDFVSKATLSSSAVDRQGHVTFLHSEERPRTLLPERRQNDGRAHRRKG